jgi:hypothetical protein
MKNWNTTLFGLAILALQLGKPFVEPKFADIIDKLTMASVVGGFASAADARRKKESLNGPLEPVEPDQQQNNI